MQQYDECRAMQRSMPLLRANTMRLDSWPMWYCVVPRVDYCAEVYRYITPNSIMESIYKKKKMKRNCVVGSPCPACARVRSSVYIKRSHSMLCVTIIIIIGGWDAHFHVSLSAALPFVCLRLCRCVCDSTLQYRRVYILFIGSAVTIVTAFGFRRGSWWVMMLPLQFPLLVCCLPSTTVDTNVMLHAPDSSKRQFQFSMAICYHFERTKFIMVSFVLLSCEPKRWKMRKLIQLFHLPF